MKLPPKKISATIWVPILKKFEEKLDRACLRRDTYLSKVLAVELPELEREIVLRNSPDACKFISQKLERLQPRKVVSFSLDETVVTRMNAVCEKQSIVRDAFLNRLLFLLSASPRAIDRLFFSDFPGDWRTQLWSEHKHDLPFFDNTFYPLDATIDPFGPIRFGLDLLEGDGDETDLSDYAIPETGESVKIVLNMTGQPGLPESFYGRIWHDRMFKGNDLYGLNCHIPDWKIPGHPVAQEYEKSLDELLGLGDL